jgi:hypothetical protein
MKTFLAIIAFFGAFLFGLAAVTAWKLFVVDPNLIHLGALLATVLTILPVYGVCWVSKASYRRVKDGRWTQESFGERKRRLAANDNARFGQD